MVLLSISPGRNQVSARAHTSMQLSETYCRSSLALLDTNLQFKNANTASREGFRFAVFVLGVLQFMVIRLLKFTFDMILIILSVSNNFMSEGKLLRIYYRLFPRAPVAPTRHPSPESSLQKGQSVLVCVVLGNGGRKERITRIYCPIFC